MNSAYFVTNILTLLEEAIFPQGRGPHRKRLVIHLDNCSIDASRASTERFEEHGMRRLPQPPYSPDLAPSDFYLFPTMKEKLERTQVADEDPFFESLQEILRRIDQEQLNMVFQAWVRTV
jgi:transposase